MLFIEEIIMISLDNQRRLLGGSGLMSQSHRWVEQRSAS